MVEHDKIVNLINLIQETCRKSDNIINVQKRHHSFGIRHDGNGMFSRDGRVQIS